MPRGKKIHVYFESPDPVGVAGVGIIFLKNVFRKGLILLRFYEEFE